MARSGIGRTIRRVPGLVSVPCRREVGNFSVSSEGKYHCFACGAEGGALTLAQQLGIEVPRTELAGPVTLAAYADVKRLDVGFPRRFGPAGSALSNEPAMRIPYMDVAGQGRGALPDALATARTSSDGPKASRAAALRPVAAGGGAGGWLCAFGRGRIGLTNAVVSWSAGGRVPGAATFKKEWAAALAGLPVFVWREPDKGGETFAKKIGEALPDCSIMVAPAGRKDVSECHWPGMTCRRCWLSCERRRGRGGASSRTAQ